MSGNVRPETMERITTLELANAFIEEQVAEVGVDKLVTDETPDFALHEAAEPRVRPHYLKNGSGGAARVGDAQYRRALRQQPHDEDNHIDDDERVGNAEPTFVHVREKSCY